MKLNKFTSALVAAGILSLAGLAQANTTIYITGSSAARSALYNAAIAPGGIFTNAAGGTVLTTGGSSSSTFIVYEGGIPGVGVVDLNCSWTGSEAGIAAVAGQTLSQSLPGNPNGSGPYALPGVPPKFLIPSAWVSGTTTDTLNNIPGAPAIPQLAMADSSQAVSLTPSSLYPLVDHGVVGVIPFTVIKGYSSSHSASWNGINNVTTAQLNNNMATPLLAKIYTGNAAHTDNVVICGRNKGSGTRVNTLLNFQYGVTTPVDQYAWGSSYPSGTPGDLTFGGSYVSGQALLEVFNDGYDSGSKVQANVNVDSTGSGIVMLGYMGTGDGKNAINPAKAGAGQVGTALPFNGVYESDAGVISGTYTFWGTEHLFGNVGQSGSSAAGLTASAIKNGIASYLVSSGAGTATGDFSTLGTASPKVGALGQSDLIPTSLMQVTRGGNDGGFPTQGSW